MTRSQRRRQKGENIYISVESWNDTDINADKKRRPRHSPFGASSFFFLLSCCSVSARTRGSAAVRFDISNSWMELSKRAGRQAGRQANSWPTSTHFPPKNKWRCGRLEEKKRKEKEASHDDVSAASSLSSALLVNLTSLFSPLQQIAFIDSLTCCQMGQIGCDDNEQERSTQHNDTTHFVFSSTKMSVCNFDFVWRKTEAKLSV